MVVMPAVMLGCAIDITLAFEKGQATSTDVIWAVLVFVGATFATQIPRMGKRWWLRTANARISANIRSDALRGVLSWPMESIHETIQNRGLGNHFNLVTGLTHTWIPTLKN